MADAYNLVRGGKLKLKKGKDKALKKQKKHSKRPHDSEDKDAINDDDALRHGGWWEISKFNDITGPVAVEIGSMRYLEAMDNGLCRLGAGHDVGEGPNPEEILTAIRINETLVALKSGYNKYLGVQSDGKVIGRADAIGGREQWEPIFQEEKMALLGCNGSFLSEPASGEYFYCSSKTAGEREFVKLRSCTKREKTTEDGKVVDAGKAKDIELGYVKKFQSFQDRRILVNPEERTAVKKAKVDGNLHEVLLDRREKMKSDKFCK